MTDGSVIRVLWLLCAACFVAVVALLILGLLVLALSMTAADLDHLLTVQRIAIFFLAVWFGSWVVLLWRGDL